jgi:hypothetical protein
MQRSTTTPIFLEQGSLYHRTVNTCTMPIFCQGQERWIKQQGIPSMAPSWNPGQPKTSHPSGDCSHCRWDFQRRLSAVQSNSPHHRRNCGNWKGNTAKIRPRLGKWLSRPLPCEFVQLNRQQRRCAWPKGQLLSSPGVTEMEAGLLRPRPLASSVFSSRSAKLPPVMPLKRANHDPSCGFGRQLGCSVSSRLTTAKSRTASAFAPK